jgi:hypothetical protein
VTFAEGKLKALLSLTENLITNSVIHKKHQLSDLESLDRWN